MSETGSLLMRLLSRRTSGGRFIPEVDGLRLIAIGSVLLFHVGGYVLAQSAERDAAAGVASTLHPWLEAWFSPGYVGVQLFFAISGLILGLPFARARLAGDAPVRIPAYFLRRLTRLEPPYLVSLVVWTVTIAAMTGISVAELLPHLAASVLYLHGAIYGEPSVISGVTWSLEVEVQFYILAPLLAGVFAIPSRRLRRLTIISGIVAAGVVQPWLPSPSPGNPLFGQSIIHQIHWFLVGFLATDILATEWRDGVPRGGRAGVGLDLGAAMGLCGIWVIMQPERFNPWVAHLAGPPCILVVICAAFRGTVLRAVLVRPGVFLVGGMCYTMYLYHSLLKAAIGGWVTGWWPPGAGAPALLLQVGIICVSIVGMSALLFIAFERPFMRPIGRRYRASSSG